MVPASSSSELSRMRRMTLERLSAISPQSVARADARPPRGGATVRLRVVGGEVPRRPLGWQRGTEAGTRRDGIRARSDRNVGDDNTRRADSSLASLAIDPPGLATTRMAARPSDFLQRRPLHP